MNGYPAQPQKSCFFITVLVYLLYSAKGWFPRFLYQNLSKFAIACRILSNWTVFRLSLHSISVMGFPIRHSACHRRDAVSATALFGMICSPCLLVGSIFKEGFHDYFRWPRQLQHQSACISIHLWYHVEQSSTSKVTIFSGVASTIHGQRGASLTCVTKPKIGVDPFVSIKS